MQKTIWAYWDQGEENAPFLVRHCLNSWRVANPDWNLILLTRNTYRNVVDLAEYEAREDMCLQAFSDLLRVTLLSDKGGVWVDATLYCVLPLSDWLMSRVSDDFFAFASKRRDRLMTNWFLYGTGDSAILKAWKDAMYCYWRGNRFREGGKSTRRTIRRFTSLRKRHLIPNDFWFSRFVTRFLKAYPYPVNMYLFEKALSGRNDLRQAWHQRSHLYDYPAELLQNQFGMNNPCTAESIAFLESGSTPVHKLNWRQDHGCAEQGSNLEYLLRMNTHSPDKPHD